MSTLIDTGRYPLHALDGEAGGRLVVAARAGMAAAGALELPGFLAPSAVSELVDEARALKPGSHRMEGRFNAYSDNLGDADDTSLSPQHPARTRLPTSHRFIAGDLIGSASPLRRIYQDPDFVEFLRRVLAIDELHLIEDRMGQVNLLLYEPGDCNGWHFDSNDFIVLIALQAAEAGGEYHYRPALRSSDDENLDAVSWQMRNPDAVDGVRYAALTAGTLFLFRGRNTLHRVTEVRGQRDRIVAVLSYHPAPGHRLSDSSKLAMYGRCE